MPRAAARVVICRQADIAGEAVHAGHGANGAPPVVCGEGSGRRPPLQADALLEQEDVAVGGRGAPHCARIGQTHVYRALGALTRVRASLRVQNTYDLDALASALLDLAGALNSRRQDEMLLREAGVTLDRALFALLARLGEAGSLGIVELGEQVGRDHSTISRQVARLEMQGLVKRGRSPSDGRIREVLITAAGQRTVTAIAQARRRLLDALLAGWSDEERAALARLNGRLADAMMAAVGVERSRRE